MLSARMASSGVLTSESVIGFVDVTDDALSSVSITEHKYNDRPHKVHL